MDWRWQDKGSRADWAGASWAQQVGRGTFLGKILFDIWGERSSFLPAVYLAFGLRKVGGGEGCCSCSLPGLSHHSPNPVKKLCTEQEDSRLGGGGGD